MPVSGEEWPSDSHHRMHAQAETGSELSLERLLRRCPRVAIHIDELAVQGARTLARGRSRSDCDCDYPMVEAEIEMGQPTNRAKEVVRTGLEMQDLPHGQPPSEIGVGLARESVYDTTLHCCGYLSNVDRIADHQLWSHPRL